MNEKIIDRLRKLIRHEKSARKMGSIKEAELFLDKIQEELDKHNLSMSEIDIREQGIDVEQEYRNVCFKREWKRLLVQSIAQVNSCQSIYDSPRMIIVGIKQDREIVYELFSYFSELGEHLATLASKSVKKEEGYIPSKFKGSFMLGYAVTLSWRFRDRHREAMASVEQTSTALVYIGDKLAKSRDFVSNNIPTKKGRMSFNVGNDDAYDDGVKAGKSVNLSDKTIEESGRKMLS